MTMVRLLGRAYYSAVGLTLVAFVCLPWLVPASYRLLGLDPQLAHEDTVAASRARAATASLRRGFIVGILVLALSVLALSIAGFALRARRTGIPPAVLALTAVAAVGAAMVAVAALLAGGSGMCC